jgi:HEPN domain-containing protein
VSYDKHKDWLDEAEDDLSSAEILLRENKYSKVCFLSQQAAEKAVKALSIAKYGRYDEIHSVSEILKRINAQKDIIEMGEILDRYYVPTRYPNAWPYGAPFKHYKKKDAEEALENARRIIEYVRSQIEGDY